MRVKLIRDRWEISQGGRVQPANTIVGKQLALVAKLHEEAEEIAKDGTDAAEYADLLEVMFELARINRVPWADIEKAVVEKRAERGAFTKGRIWIVDEPEPMVWNRGYPEPVHFSFNCKGDDVRMITPSGRQHEPVVVQKEWHCPNCEHEWDDQGIVPKSCPNCGFTA